jgi:hypothetical protein
VIADNVNNVSRWDSIDCDAVNCRKNYAHFRTLLPLLGMYLKLDRLSRLKNYAYGPLLCLPLLHWHRKLNLRPIPLERQGTRYRLPLLL